MRLAPIRNLLFQLHMWIGLGLGILFALLGLSGSLLVYEDGLADLIDPPPIATSVGKPLSLQRLIEVARGAAPGAHGAVTVILPQMAGEAALVRLGQLSRMGSMPGMPSTGVQFYLDPVSGAVLGERHNATPPAFIVMHQLHSNFLMGKAGHSLVGWLGVAMLLLGISGLVLWWPKRGQWKYAFLVRRTAKGLRFHRELHAAAGIWTFLIFMIVSFSGVALAFPVTLRTAAGSGPAVARDRPSAPAVIPLPDGMRPNPDTTATQARNTFPGLALQSLVFPARPDQAVTATFAKPDGLIVTAFLDRGRVIAARDVMTTKGADFFVAAQRPIHEGKLLGPVWGLLVFLSGLLPTLFLVTGTVMWASKRRRRLAMNAPLAADR
jgi:uncharacterized iron-regulated membrane protein